MTVILSLQKHSRVKVKSDKPPSYQRSFWTFKFTRWDTTKSGHSHAAFNNKAAALIGY